MAAYSQTSSPVSTDLQLVPAVKMLDLGPDPMANWPWPRMQNPHYLEIKNESKAWVRSLKPFNPASQCAFEKGDFCLLAALANPNLSREHFRATCDLMNLFFVIDEYTDVESAEVVKEMVDICVDALHHPHTPRPKSECVIGEATKQFWELTIKTATSTCQNHFIKTFTEYLNSLIEQAKDRDNDEIQSIESYIANRRFNVGMFPSLALIEQPLNIPEKAIYHPLVIKLQECIADLVWIANDIASYNKEQAIGDVRHNILTVVMHELGYDYTKALKWALDYQAKDRDNDEIQSIESYIANRRFNVGMFPSLALIEQPLNIPEKAIYHPLVIKLQECIADLVWIANDIASYNKEQAIGDVRHNILTVVMHELGYDYTKALKWALDYHIKAEKKFLDEMKSLPSFGKEVDRELKKYLYEIGFWPRGHDSWTFECGRYFGDKGLEVQRTRQVPLLLKMQYNGNLKKENIIVQKINF